MSETIGDSVRERIDGAMLARRIRPPGMPAWVVERRRLHGVVDRLFDDHRVVTLVSPLGSGKTVTAQLYAEHSGLPLSWLTLDPSDASPGRLLVDLASALEPSAPGAVEAVSAALRSAWRPAEVAAVLGEMIAPGPAILVIDEAEAIHSSDVAPRVLCTLVEYAPPGLRVLIAGREQLGGPILRGVLDGTFAVVAGEDLRLSMDETRDLLSARGLATTDVGEAYAATGGWVAGVVFGAPFDVALADRSTDFSAFVRVELLDPLPPEEQQFLLETSVVDVVTLDMAVALFGPEARALWERIRARRLPATSMTADSIVYHDVVRSVLRSELTVRCPEREIELRRLCAARYEQHRDYVSAVDLYLAVGALDEAAAAAELALPAAYERGDWWTILRWLEELGTERVDASPALVAATLLALGAERRRDEITAEVRRAEEKGLLRAAAEADPRVRATIVWAMQSTPNEARRLLDAYPGTEGVAAVRFALEATAGDQAVEPPPTWEWDGLDAIVAWGLLWQGRLDTLIQMEPEAEDLPVMNTTLLLAHVWRGDVATARSVWQRVPEEIQRRAGARFVESYILLAEGELELALAAAKLAIVDCPTTSFSHVALYEVFRAALLAGLGEVDEAISMLTARLPALAECGHADILEVAQAALGLALLVKDRPEDALAVLDPCVRSMTSSGRALLLPAAAAYLAEARTRTGDADGAAAASTLAQTAADAIGCDLRRVVSLVGVTRVAERGLLRALPAPTPSGASASNRGAGLRVEVQPFGRDRDIHVDGVAADVKRLKVIELAACLSLHPNGIDRFELQQRLFPDADRRRGGNHFRQIAHKLREATGLQLVRSARNTVSWPADVEVTSIDASFEAGVEVARTLAGAERLAQLTAALALVPGPYLEHSDLSWAEERRYQLDLLREEAFLDVATLQVECGDWEPARASCEAVLKDNPYCEQAYVDLLRVERAIGTASSGLAVYRRAVAALDELGLEPGPALRASVADGNLEGAWAP